MCNARITHCCFPQVLDDLVTSIQAHPSIATLTSSSSTVTSKAQLGPSADKVVVVSNFTSTLDAVANLLRCRKVKFLRIDGTVTAERRSKFVDFFNKTDSPITVMLLSAKAGGVGINLVGANRLVMLDPDWNPATDQQAMGRVWREGQTKPVFIYRLIAQNSIEESILHRQTGKVCVP